MYAPKRRAPVPEMSSIPAKPNDWYVYIVLCRDNTLYTGITNSLERRIQAHNSKKCGAKYTSSRRPVQLVYFEPADSKSGALKREYQVRTLHSKKKRELILSSYKDLKNAHPDIKISVTAIRKIRKP
jgi:putative endonuclease